MIQESEYQKRRSNLAKKLSKNSIAILFSSEQKIRSNDTEYPYRQESNFYYLSGFKEDNSALVVLKNKKKFQTILFVQKKDEQMELWSGKRVGEKKAKAKFLVDEVYPYEEFEKKIKEFALGKKSIYLDNNITDKRVKSVLEISKNIQTTHNILHVVQEMRLLKSDAEIKLISKAINITKKAHHALMRAKKEGKFEYELQANVEYIFKKNGAYSDAYTTIVASGNNANTLHYIQNSKKMKKNELVLIDAGCEYNYYASDITRTIPVSGTFTKPQKELYALVLAVEQKIISMIKPHVKRTTLQSKAEFLLTTGMVKLGILSGDIKELIKQKKHKKYFPHGIGHWMGIDVHDPAPYKNLNSKEIRLNRGMVLTIEPGIYIDKNDKDVPKKYRGIGIRVEDNILVTKKGHKNLSANIIKSIKEIELIYAKG